MLQVVLDSHFPGHFPCFVHITSESCRTQKFSSLSGKQFLHILFCFCINLGHLHTMGTATSFPSFPSFPNLCIFNVMPYGILRAWSLAAISIPSNFFLGFYILGQFLLESARGSCVFFGKWECNVLFIYASLWFCPTFRLQSPKLFAPSASINSFSVLQPIYSAKFSIFISAQSLMLMSPLPLLFWFK